MHEASRRVGKMVQGASRFGESDASCKRHPERFYISQPKQIVTSPLDARMVCVQSQNKELVHEPPKGTRHLVSVPVQCFWLVPNLLRKLVIRRQLPVFEREGLGSRRMERLDGAFFDVSRQILTFPA